MTSVTAGWGQVICRDCALREGLEDLHVWNLLVVLEPIPPGYKRMTVYFKYMQFIVTVFLKKVMPEVLKLKLGRTGVSRLNKNRELDEGGFEVD